jgi:alpha-L-rhamnosidase
MSNTRRAFLRTGAITVAGLTIVPKIILSKNDRCRLEIDPDIMAATWATDDPVGTTLDQSFIWAPPAIAPKGQQIYIVFRKTVDIKKMPLLARLAIFADSRYRLWINSHFVDSGPCRFDPRWPEYDMHDVLTLLEPGRNVIVVLVHAYEIGSFTKWGEQCARMMDHRPGLTAQLRLDLPNGKQNYINTDSTWKLNSKTRFLPSPGTYSSVPDNIDARLDDGDWTSSDYNDGRWESALPIKAGDWGPLHPRSIPLLRQVLLEAPAIIEPAGTTFPLKLTGGQQGLFDFGRTVQASAILDFDASSGSELELVHCAQYYDIGRKSNQVTFTGNTFRDRYRARSGRQTYMSGDTWGGRYLWLIVRSGNILLHDLQAVDRTYPFTRLGQFNCNDVLLNKIWDIGVRTVEVCSEDAHVDCADRERAQWMADGFMMGWPVSRVALSGPGTVQDKPKFADSRLLRNMLRHMGLSQLPDGRLQPMRPSSYPPGLTHGVIDDYSCLWVQAVREYYDITGDKAFIIESWPVVIKTLSYFLERRTQHGLVRAMEFIYFKNPLIYKVCEGTSINCYIYRSLKDAGYLADVVSDRINANKFEAAARTLLLAINSELWDETAGSYYSGIIDDVKQPPTGHAATLALFYEIVPSENRSQVFAFMNEHLVKEEAFPYTYRYFFDVLYRYNTEDADKFVLDLMRKQWAHMTRYETGTTSEDWNGGSFIHESGAHPAWFMSSYVLGVRVEGPRSARRLLIEPRLADLQSAEGTVLCEYGPVAVSWHRMDGGKTLTFNVNIPSGASAMVRIPIDSTRSSLVVDDRKLVHAGSVVSNQVRIEGRFASIELVPGRHVGESRIE